MRYLLAGDSTVAACPPEEHPMSGWGPALASWLPSGDEVLNFAKGGATTESFIAEGLWASVLAELHSGDTVVIQFGHNDQKRPEVLAPDGGYTSRLAGFIRDVNDGGGRPVLCTSVERRLFEGQRLRHSHGAYPTAVRRLALARDLPLIDLTVFTSWLYEYLGVDQSAALFTELDNTHFHERGASLVAQFVARSLRAAQCLDDHLEPLGSQQ